MDPLALSLAVVGFLCILGALLLPRLARRKAPAPRPRNISFVPTPAEEKRLNEARELLVQIETFSTRSFARLDTKMRFLNRLIEDADVRIRTLETSKGRNGGRP
jgi:hypothetical protein